MGLQSHKASVTLNYLGMILGTMLPSDAGPRRLYEHPIYNQSINQSGPYQLLN